MSLTPHQISATGRCVRAWIGTGNDQRHWKDFFTNVLAAKCVWAIAQVEVAPTTGHHHLQYAMYFKNDHDLKWMKKHIHPTDWFHEMNGTFEHSLKYCTDPEKRLQGTPDEVGPWQVGQMPRQGARTDLTSIGQAIVSGEYRTYREFALAHPHVILRMDRGVQALFELLPPPPRCKTTCIYMWGPPDIGKSTGWLRAGISPQDKYVPGFEAISRTINFSRYDMQPLVIVDEIDGYPQPRNWWLQFAEEYSVLLPVKGSKPVYWNSNVIIVTSNRPPLGIHLDDGAWTRRWKVHAVQTRRDVELVYREVAGLILPSHFCTSAASGAPVHAAEPPAQVDGVEVPISGTG